LTDVTETKHASRRSFGMLEWARRNWIILAWYSWLATLACAVAGLFLFG